MDLSGDCRQLGKELRYQRTLLKLKQKRKKDTMEKEENIQEFQITYVIGIPEENRKNRFFEDSDQRHQATKLRFSESKARQIVFPPQ